MVSNPFDVLFNATHLAREFIFNVFIVTLSTDEECSVISPEIALSIHLILNTSLSSFAPLRDFHFSK